VALRRNQVLDGLDVLTLGSLLLQRPRKCHLTTPSPFGPVTWTSGHAFRGGLPAG
jgi:hypothetical protein